MKAPAEAEPRMDRHAGWRGLLPVAPLHPIFVHFTIGLTASSLLFDALGRLMSSRSLAEAGWWTLALSGSVTVLTIVTGLISRARLEMGEGRARDYLRTHMAIGPVFLGLEVPLLVWRYGLWAAGQIPSWLYVAVLSGLNIVMLVQGYLGGELVYRWGAEVRGRHTTLHQEQAATSPPAAPWLQE